MSSKNPPIKIGREQKINLGPKNGDFRKARTKKDKNMGKPPARGIDFL